MTVSRRGGREAVIGLQIFSVTVLLLPSDMVIGAIGAAGHAANLVAITLFALYWAGVLLGFHDHNTARSPVRAALALLWLATLLSYAASHLVVDLSPAERLAADRWLLQLLGVSGVVLVAGDHLRDIEAVHRVLRVLIGAATVVGVFAALQFWVRLDLTWILRFALPGFESNVAGGGILDRGGLARVSGTAIHPIELGVVAAMLLPLALHLALADRTRGALWRWVPVVAVGVMIAGSVSRSAILCAAIAVAVFVVLLPPMQRVLALGLLPVAVAGAFLTARGLIGTLWSYFSAGTSDPSISTRVDDYPFVERRVAEQPWFGQGGGTFFPADAFEILDNQYLKTAIELGLFGLAALLLFFAAPVVTAWAARGRTTDPDTRLLCAAVMAAATAGAVGSVAFDSLSFPMFTGVHALVAGLAAACWHLSRPSADPPRPAPGARTAAVTGSTPGVT